MRFAIPSLLWLLILVPVCAFLLVWAISHRRELISRFATDKVLERGSFLRSAAVLWTRMGLLLGAIVFLIIGLARPQWGFHERQVVTQGVDMMVAIDTSASMMARDYAPTRLSRAKELLLNLIWEAQGERVGVLAFAGSAAVMCPLTLDYNMAVTALKAVDMNTVPTRGTDIGAAIMAGVNAFEVSGGSDRVLVLLTDGEQLERKEQLDAAIAKAQQDGVHIFAIGLGTPDGSTIPTMRGPLRDNAGNVVNTKLDFELLQRIAKETGGMAIMAEKMGSAEIAQISAELSKFRGQKQQDKTYRVYHERYPLFVGVALVLLALEALLRGARGIRTRLGRKSADVAAIVLGMGLAALNGSAMAYPGETFVESREALQKYQAGNYDEAVASYEQASDRDPHNPQLIYNLGVSTAKAGQTSVARDLLGKVYDPDTPQLNLKARYSMATVDYREIRKEIASNRQGWEQELAMGSADARADVEAMIARLDQVITEYQQVILAQPDDMDVKVNYELAKRDKAELEKLLKDNEQQQQEQQQQDQQNEEQQDQNEQQQEGQQGEQDQEQDGQSGEEKQDEQESGQDDQNQGENDQQQDQQGQGENQENDQQKDGEQEDQQPGEQQQDSSQDNQQGQQSGQQPQQSPQGTPTPTPAPQGTPSPTPRPTPTPAPTGTPASGQPQPGEGQSGAGQQEQVPIGQMSASDVDRLLNTLPPENQQALQFLMGTPTEHQDMEHEW